MSKQIGIGDALALLEKYENLVVELTAEVQQWKQLNAVAVTLWEAAGKLEKLFEKLARQGLLAPVIPEQHPIPPEAQIELPPIRPVKASVPRPDRPTQDRSPRPCSCGEGMIVPAKAGRIPTRCEKCTRRHINLQKSATRKINGRKKNPDTDPITALLPSVQNLAAKFSTRSGGAISREDLFGAGQVALVEAASRFDHSKNVSFWTFAIRRVIGAMKDSMRQLDPHTRSERKALREGTSTIQEKKVVPILPKVEDGDTDNLPTVAPTQLDHLIEKDEEQRKLDQVKKALSEAPESERKVIELLLEGRTWKQITEETGVVESTGQFYRRRFIARVHSNGEKLPNELRGVNFL